MWEADAGEQRGRRPFGRQLRWPGEWRGRWDGTGGNGDREQGTRVLFGRPNQQGLLTSGLGGLRHREDLGGPELQERGTLEQPLQGWRNGGGVAVGTVDQKGGSRVQF